jgi:hypothetical protein
VARSILEANRTVLDRLADELVEHETLEAERVMEIFAPVERWDAERADSTGRSATAAASHATTTGQSRREPGT